MFEKSIAFQGTFAPVEDVELSKKSSCKICKRKYVKRTEGLFGLEYVRSPEMHIYPRQALHLDRRLADWVSKPTRFESYPRSVVIVCQPMCLLEMERAKYPKLNEFMERFRLTELYRELLMWSAERRHMLPQPEHFNKCDTEIPHVSLSMFSRLFSLLLTHKESHPGRSTRNSNPVVTSSAGLVPRVV